MERKRPFLKRFRDWVVYILARFLLFAGAYIPAFIGRALGAALGVTAFTFARRERNKTLKNLELGLGNELSVERRREIAKGMFIHYGHLLFEVMRIRRLNANKVRKTIEFEGLELVKEAIEAGRGVVVATGHIGNWELLGSSAVQMGVPVNVIARRLNDPRMDSLIIRLREKAGVRTIIRESPDSAKRILRCLRRGEMLALLIDQDTKVDGCFVPFFGRPAYTPTGAATLALRTGSLLVAAAIHRTGKNRHFARAVPIEVSKEIDSERAITEATAKVTSQLESWIRERPEQWCWNHDRWRRKPDQAEEG